MNKNAKIKIDLNWKLLIIILILIALLVFVVIYLRSFRVAGDINVACVLDEDCAPKCGCHPDECVLASERGECDKLICTQECSGKLDCGNGECKCVDNECSVV